MNRMAFIFAAAIALSGCSVFGGAQVYGEIPECDRLIPASLKSPVPGVPLPNTEEAEEWMKAFIGQTGQLDKANERPEAIDHIYKTCLDNHRRALNRAKRGFFGRIFS